MADWVRVFVYGTLKPREFYYDRYCAGKVVESQEAIVFGQLFDLPFGYPAMTQGDRPVYGFLLSFANPTMLDALDELEDYHPDRPIHENEYVRVELEAFSFDRQSLGLVWVYQMDQTLAETLGGILLPDGCWAGQKKI